MIYPICFGWLQLWYFMWGEGTKRNAEYPAVAFLLCLRFVLASIFLDWLSALCLLPTYLTCASAVPAWKRKCTLTLYFTQQIARTWQSFSPWLIPVSSASCLALSHFLLILPLFLMFIFYGGTEVGNLQSVNTMSISQQRACVIFVLFGC